MESTGTTQDHLVRAAQAGDHAAFEKLVYVHDQAVLDRVKYHRLAQRCSGYPSRSIHKGLQKARWLPL